MVQKLVSVIIEDDNPHLRRVPFVLLWFVSYGLAWYVLYIYEMLWYDWNFDALLSWLKSSPQGPWREALVLGLLFGVTLSSIQTWLIRQRYGYVPKYWRAATILGAIIAGFGYPRIGLRTGEYLLGLNWMGVNNTTSADSLINDFIIWFIALGLFPAIVMLQVNRKAWIMVAVGVLAGAIASVPLLNPGQLFGKPMWTLIMGTTVQAIGTALLVLHFMAHPREAVVDKLENTQDSANGSIAAAPFIWLWVGIFCLHSVLTVALPELWGFLLYYSPDAIFYGLDLRSSRWTWYFSAVLFGIIGSIIATAQQWLVKKHRNCSIPGWHRFTLVGWAFAGIAWWGFRYGGYPRTEVANVLMFGSFLTIPTLFQAVPLSRVFKGGWIWAVIGVLAGLFAVFIRGVAPFQMSNFYGRTLAGLALSFGTAFIFSRLPSQDNATPPARAGTEGA